MGLEIFGPYKFFFFFLFTNRSWLSGSIMFNDHTVQSVHGSEFFNSGKIIALSCKSKLLQCSVREWFWVRSQLIATGNSEAAAGLTCVILYNERCLKELNCTKHNYLVKYLGICSNSIRAISSNSQAYSNFVRQVPVIKHF